MRDYSETLARFTHFIPSSYADILLVLPKGSSVLMTTPVQENVSFPERVAPSPEQFWLVYGGSNTGYNVANRTPLAPSAVENTATNTMPKEMSKAVIQKVIQAFAAAAHRAEIAGFDGIQLHIAHGYLLNQFLCPYYNRRTDEYGGSVENRSRIIIETLKSVRKVVRKDFVLMAKINCDDFMDKGLRFERHRGQRKKWFFARE